MYYNKSKFLVFLEKIYYLIIINTMILLGSVLFVTFLNSIASGLYSLRLYIEKDDCYVIKNYIYKFKEISFKGIYSNIILYFWFALLYIYLPLIDGQHISGLIFFYFIFIELIILSIGLIKVFSKRKISTVVQNTKKAIFIGHFELPSIIFYFISILSSLLILYKIKLLIPLFIAGPAFLLIKLSNKFKITRSLK